MNMKLKKSDVNILIILVGILIPVAVYFFVFNKYTEKTDALNASNAQLQQEVDYLQDLADHKEEYVQNTEAYLLNIEEIKTHFPAEYKPEDDILYIIGVEQQYGAGIPTIGMGSPSLISIEKPAVETVGAGAVEVAAESEEGDVVAEDAADNGLVPDFGLYSTSVSVRMTSNYNALKDIITKLNEDQNRKSIDSISVVFDADSGDLASSLVFSAYSLTGTDNTYETPVVPGVTYGTYDIFNSGAKAAVAAEIASEE